MTVNYELSVKLKELGIVQKSEKCWIKTGQKINLHVCEAFEPEQLKQFNYVSAFTLGELFRMIPIGFKLSHDSKHEIAPENSIAELLIKAIKAHSNDFFDINEINNGYLKAIENEK